MSRTHNAIAVTERGVLAELRLETPEPQEEEVLVKVEYSGLAPFDGYTVDSAYHVTQYPLPLGLNAAGTVVQVGPNVEHLKVGDRVATLARADEVKGKSMQEYALLKKYSIVKIPDTLSFPEAATIPDRFITAYLVVFETLRLPIPPSFPAPSPPAESATPILVYGAGTTTGQSVIQILRLAGYKRILATASAKHHDFLYTLGATDVFDYRRPDLLEQIMAVNAGKPIKYAVDCVTTFSTLREVAKFVGKGSIVSLLLPIKEGDSIIGKPDDHMWLELPQDRNPFVDGVEVNGAKAFTYQQNRVFKETLLPKVLPQLLADRLILPNRVRLLEHGTFKERVEEALDLMRNNKISGEKLVVKVA